MPFGLKGAALTFQMLVDSASHDLTFLFVYIDEYIGIGKWPDCQPVQFGLPVVDFWGILLRDGAPLPSKMRLALDIPHPVWVKALQ